MVCVGCFLGSGNQPHATIPKHPNVGGHSVASEKVRTMKKTGTQEELSTDWEVTMPDGCSVAVERPQRPATTGTWAHKRELPEASPAQDIQKALFSK